MSQGHSGLRDHSSSSTKVTKSPALTKKKSKLQGYKKVSKADRFTCPKCNEVLGRKSSLVRHLKAHTGQKEHICEICGRKFQEKGQLKRHNQVHTGEKPFQCQICGKCYSDNVNLKKHQQRCTFESKINVMNDKIRIEEEKLQIAAKVMNEPYLNLSPIVTPDDWLNLHDYQNNQCGQWLTSFEYANLLSQQMLYLELLTLRTTMKPKVEATDAQKLVNGFFK